MNFIENEDVLFGVQHNISYICTYKSAGNDLRLIANTIKRKQEVGHFAVRPRLLLWITDHNVFTNELSCNSNLLIPYILVKHHPEHFVSHPHQTDLVKNLH